MKKKNNKGFTLIELIIVITILGIIGVTIFGSLSINTQSKQSIEMEGVY